VIVRVLELIFAAIVVGILDRCQHYLDAAHVDSNSRRLHSSHGRYQHMCRDHLDAPTQILFLGLSTRLRPLRILDGFVWAFRKCKLYNSLPLPRESAWILSDVLTWNDSSPEPVAATHTGIGIIGGYYWGRYYYTLPINQLHILLSAQPIARNGGVSLPLALLRGGSFLQTRVL
jgi:hypothetical protein